MPHRQGTTGCSFIFCPLPSIARGGKTNFGCVYAQAVILGTLSTDATGQLNVLVHDSDAAGMDGAKVLYVMMMMMMMQVSVRWL